MESYPSFDPNQRNFNYADVLNGDGNTKGGQNLFAVTVYSYPRMFLLDPNRGINIGKRLVIERQTGRISELAITEKIPENFEKKKAYSAFLGILNILDKTFLLMADDAVAICSIENNDIFQLGSTTFIPFENETDLFASQSGRETINYIQNIRKLLSMGHYFSYGYNLTLSKMKQTTTQSTDMRFAWNSYLFKDLLKFNVDKKWMLPIIQGLICFFDVYLMGKKLEFFLISRRSCLKAGTRYNARGIDDNGNVANFCETEQVIYYNGYCCSYLQIRGSVPVFWQQRGMTAQTKISRSYDLTNAAFCKHFEDVNNTYGRVLCVNLLAKGKSGEQMITESFEQHVRTNNLGNVRYEYFDFHHACRGQKFSKVNPLINKLTSMIENFRFYAEDTFKKNVLLTQKGIIRTNCLDCLDRTNVFQTKIAIIIFDAQMRQLGVDLTSTFGQDVLSQLDNDNPKQQHPFILKFKNAWADNGDIISMHYAGTGSVISGVTRTGKRNFFGLLDHGMKTLNRFYIGNFEDQIKQESIDILLGQHTETVNVFGETFEKAVKAREKEFSTFDEISIFTATWNIGGFEPTPQFDLSNLFNWEGNTTPDVVVIGFQEFVSLNAKNIMVTSGESTIALWRNIIENNLRRHGRYLFVRERSLVGVLTLIFAKESIRDRITRVEADSVKTGLAGKLGNKGGVVVRLCVDDSSFAFINVHLEAGTNANNSRLMNIIDIHQRAFQEEGVGKRREERIMQMDYKFLIGDTNFRVNYPNTEVRAMIDGYINFMGNGRPQQANGLLAELLKYDQLKNTKESSDILEKYQEGAITFLPTYKYDKYSNVYDSSKKQRTPSWTDRILWSCDFGIVKQLFYDRREIKDSDHRPVVSMFVLEVKKVNQAKREEIVKQIYENDASLRKAIEDEEAMSKDFNLLEDEFASSNGNASGRDYNNVNLI